MSGIAANFAQVRERIALACAAVAREASDVELLAVSKFHVADAVREALAVGQVAFGESRVQDLVAKAQELKAEPQLQWHLIGSLQTNKVREVLGVSNLALVHSLDRLKLADALQRELAASDRAASDRSASDRAASDRAASDRCLDVLLQVNASGEEQKHGCDFDAVPALLDHVQANCPALRVRGLMAMGPLHGSARPAFDRVANLRDSLQQRTGLALPTLSLGMSGDLEDAIAAGSTMVRIGTALFGER